MIRAAGIALCLVLAGPAAAQTDVCPFHEGRKVFGDWRPMSHLLIAVSYRKECGLISAEDHRAIRSIHEDRGCPADSGIGSYFNTILTAPTTPDTQHPGLAELRDRDPVGFYRFCRMAAYISWPEDGATFLIGKPDGLGPDRLQQYQTFWAHLEAMQNELTRMMKEL